MLWTSVREVLDFNLGMSANYPDMNFRLCSENVGEGCDRLLYDFDLHTVRVDPSIRKCKPL
jgi:hypothetical protein